MLDKDYEGDGSHLLKKNILREPCITEKMFFFHGSSCYRTIGSLNFRIIYGISLKKVIEGLLCRQLS